MNRFIIGVYIKSLFILLVLTTLLDPGTKRELSIDASKVLVLDGDTIKIKKTKEKIRLFGIDAPELKQQSLDYKKIGLLSKKFLFQLIKNKTIRISYLKKGYYGRWIGELFFWQNGKLKNINKIMIKRGHALIYVYSKFRSRLERQEFIQLQMQAQRRRFGIWKTKGFYSPKEYRKNKKHWSAKKS